MAESTSQPIYEVEEIDDVELARYRKPGNFWTTVVFIMTVISLALATNQIFRFEFFKVTTGNVLVTQQYMFLILGSMLSMIFILMPAYKGAPMRTVPLYDKVLFLLALCLTVYFTYFGQLISEEAWEYEFNAPWHASYVAIVFWAMILEAGRRGGGWPVFFVCLIFSLFPTFAGQVPQAISGVQSTFFEAASYHIYSEESVLGIPMQAFALLVFGFLLFGNALVYTGGGQFFINLAFAMLGHVRGGPAKVAIFSSGLFGSMSGGPITNVLTTGALTIPAMKRIGIRAKTAGAIEACASTGGTMMPPIMGATAFVMADFLQVSYVDVALAAVVPSMLYYIGLFMQIDAYAAQNNLKGLDKSELPTLWSVVKDGWYYIFAFALLVFMLVFLQREARAPFYATVVLLAVNQFSPKHRLDWKTFKTYLYATGGLLAELGGLLAAVGLVVGALQATGMTGSITNILVNLAGDTPIVLLCMGAITSFILGMGMTVTAAYIFLAIILAPALIKVGMDPMAVHMFVLYWGMLSFITPPVALAAFAASTVAKCEPMETGIEAMRIGTVIYFIPFFFVFNPALLLQGSPSEVIIVCATALAGILLVSAGLQGWLIGVGSLGRGFVSLIGRISLIVGGLTLAAPGGGMLGFDHTLLLVAAVIIVAPGVLIAWMNGRRSVKPA
ncbi:MAG: TRAP transporter permease [Alphaproteobacteria bacterium]